MKKARDIMTVAPMCASKDTPLGDIAQRMLDARCGCIPIYRDEQSRVLVGVVTDRDIVCRALAKGQNPLELTAGAVMTSPAITVGPDATVGQCSETMERHRIRRLPVVDESSHCIGIVSIADVVDALTQAMTAELIKELSTPTRAPAVV